MSEYQYYEFQTIDQPLNAEQRAYLSTLSSRVQLTSSSAVYTYSYSDLPANPLQVLADHFDAMLYVANWGSKQLVFRFPQNALNPDELKAYLAFDEMSLESSGDYLILNIDFNPEEGTGEWIEGDGMLSSMIALRNDILDGDLRALYLVWLQAALNYELMLSDEEVEEEDLLDDELEGGDPELIEPPLPPGLQQLTPALTALIEFIELDTDLVAAAAQASPPLVSKSEPFEEWVTKLPIHERNAFLVRFARREPRVHIDLLTRLREVGQSGGALISTSQPRRSFAEIKSAARQQQQIRQQKEHEAAERKRLEKLDKLAKRQKEAWLEVAQNLAKRNASGYDTAVALLVELHDLALHRKQQEAFEGQFGEIVGPYLKSSALQQRMYILRMTPGVESFSIQPIIPDLGVQSVARVTRLFLPPSSGSTMNLVTTPNFSSVSTIFRPGSGSVTTM
jgi:hypothetical protein